MFDITQKFMIDPTKELSFAEFALKAQNLYGMDFLGIVTQYAEERDLEFELLDIMPRLAKIKHNKAQSRLHSRGFPTKSILTLATRKSQLSRGVSSTFLLTFIALGLSLRKKHSKRQEKPLKAWTPLPLSSCPWSNGCGISTI